MAKAKGIVSLPVLGRSGIGPELFMGLLFCVSVSVSQILLLLGTVLPLPPARSSLGSL